MRVAITGGAGFIGQALARWMLRRGHELTILDSFLPQIHGCDGRLPPDLEAGVRLVRGDVNDPAAVAATLRGQEAVVHLAAETGTGQSMYELVRYERTNIGGTACLLQWLLENRGDAPGKFVLASSRAVYGEGSYRCPEHGLVYPASRSKSQLDRGEFTSVCPICGAPSQAVATSEKAELRPQSFYGLTKLAQEQMVRMYGEQLRMNTVILRYQNVYGPGQALRNPYTGVLAIFSSLARSGEPITLLENGTPTRDFVFIDDVVAATATCLLESSCSGTFNVGSGVQTSIADAAGAVLARYNSPTRVVYSTAYRAGDVHHCYADLTRIKERLGWQPQWSLAAGLERLVAWSREQPIAAPRLQQAQEELSARGLLHE